ncbi:MAG: hypothetical protein AB8H47_26075 [Bacteroidia bacterium]
MRMLLRPLGSLLLLGFCLALPIKLDAQISDSTSEAFELPDGYRAPQGDSVLRPLPLRKLNVNGYYRFFGYGRNMTTPYPNLSPYEKAAGVGDGYREPMLSLFVSGRPNAKSSFATELYFFTPYEGSTQGNVFTMNLGINLYGNFRTRFGKFGVRAGGIHWYAMSPMTMGIFQVADRYSIFDRTPWEGVDGTGKYDNYYNTGAINQDIRWNNRAFQGLIVEGGSLPGGMSFAFMYGKAQANGGLLQGQTDPLNTIIQPGIAGNLPTYNGFSGINRALPNSFTGFRLKKNFGTNFIAYNTIYNQNRLDSIKDVFQTYGVHTLHFQFNPIGLNLSGEVGAGNFTLPGQETKWGETVLLRLGIPKRYTYLPLNFEFYQISKNFYNDNGEVQTFSNPEIQNSSIGPNQIGQASVAGALAQVGQLVHNRRGINLNTEKNFGPLRINVGWGISQEIDTLSSELSYVHRINGLALSRIYNPFPLGATGPTVVGPYNRVFTFFRGAYERVGLTDIDPGTTAPLSRKHFQALELQVKFKTDLVNRPLYLFYLGTWMGASDKMKFIPGFDDDVYLQTQYHELDLYYALFPRFILAGYMGLEYIKGGRNTEWDLTTQQPRNQFGRGIAVGFDWTVSKNAAFYVRQRFMKFEDLSFPLDRYQGNETTIELKVFF